MVKKKGSTESRVVFQCWTLWGESGETLTVLRSSEAKAKEWVEELFVTQGWSKLQLDRKTDKQLPVCWFKCGDTLAYGLDGRRPYFAHIRKFKIDGKPLPF